MIPLQLTQIGDSVGLILPDEILAHLGLNAGDTVFVTEGENGLIFTPIQPSLESEEALGREFMQQYRQAFRRLAK
jgi:putative addiction module antidote